MSIASDLIRGNTDMIILAQLMRRESYGYEINKNIQQKTGGLFEFKEATLYGAFRRLEEAGFVSFYWGDEQTGARRRYYSITEMGRRAYSDMLDDWRWACGLIESMIVAKAADEKNEKGKAAVKAESKDTAKTEAEAQAVENNINIVKTQTETQAETQAETQTEAKYKAINGVAAKVKNEGNIEGGEDND